MKKKLVLGVLAAVLILTLAIGGTLMLFTAESEVATNVVTLGDLSIKLQEKGGPSDPDDPSVDYENENYKDVVNEAVTDGFHGIDFGVGVPNQTFYKYPRVVHTGGVDAYLRVKGTLVVKDPEDIDPETAVKVYSLLTGDQQRFLYELLSSADVGDGWEFVPDGDSQTSVGYYGSGYYYYVGDSNSLKQFVYDAAADEDKDAENTYPNATGPIFTSFKIPNWTQAELNGLGETFLGWSFRVELQAQAVQADYNDVADSTDWALYFSEF